MDYSFFNILDLLGTMAFAISGALAAMNRKLDIFGIFIIAFVTAVGGGTVRESNRTISMLVARNESTFSKKATGKIRFICNDGHLITEAIEKTIATGEGQTFWMKSIGYNEDGVEVSTFDFEWTLRIK